MKIELVKNTVDTVYCIFNVKCNINKKKKNDEISTTTVWRHEEKKQIGKKEKRKKCRGTAGRRRKEREQRSRLQRDTGDMALEINIGFITDHRPFSSSWLVRQQAKISRKMRKKWGLETRRKEGNVSTFFPIVDLSRAFWASSAPWQVVRP